MNEVLKEKHSRYLVWLGVALALGIGLRLWGLGSKELWFDESFGAILAGRSPGQILDQLSKETAPPLYYFLLRIWAGFFGRSEWALRLLSAIFGILMIPCVWIAAKRIFSRRSADWVAMLFALHPLAILYSQEARMYTMTPLLGLAVFYSVWMATDRGGPGPWIAYVIAQAILLYTHYHGILLFPAAWAVVLVQPSRRRVFLLLACQMLALMLFVPWLPILKEQAASHGAAEWIGYYWNRYPPSLAIPKSFASMLPGGPWPEYLILDCKGPFSVPLAVIWAGAAGAGIVAILLDKNYRRQSLSLLIFFALPIILAWIISFIWKPLLVVGRYELAVWPALMILICAGWSRLHTLFRSGLAIVLAATVVLVIFPYYSTEQPERYRERARIIAGALKPESAVIYLGSTRAPVHYYLDRLGFSANEKVYPPFLSEDIGQGWFDRSEVDREPARYRIWARQLMADVASTSGTGGPIALVEELYHIEGRVYRWRGERIILGVLAERGYRRDTLSRPDIGVLFFSKEGP